MSRAGAAKGVKDKTNKPPASQTPVTATEIVPGKFNESDWNAMVERDSSEDFVLDIVDEVLGSTMDAIFKMYLGRQLLPFTITQAKDAILQIIEWQFLARDEGEEGIAESNWIQDEEPDAAVTDCWAQGSVPKTLVPLPSLIPEEVEEVVEEEEIEKVKDILEPEEPEIEDKVSDDEAPEEQDAKEAEAERIAAEAKRKEEEKAKKKKKFTPYRGKLKSAGVSRLTESLEETEMQMYMKEMVATMSPHEISSNLMTMPASCHSILRVQNGRPPGNKDVEYDEMGNVVAVMKLDTHRLPTHRVNVRYHVVDPSVEAAQARLEAMRRGRYIAPTEKYLGKKVVKKSCSDSTATASSCFHTWQAGNLCTVPHVPLVDSGKSKRKSTDSSKTLVSGKTSLKSMKHRKPTITSLPPTLLETMDVATGVVVTEAGRTKKGPVRYVRKTDCLDKQQRDLQPVTIKIKSNPVSVSDLLDRNTPILRPMDESRPLPPIIPTPPTGTPLST